MAEIVHIDETKELPLAKVRHLNITPSESNDPDPFSKPISEIRKNYNGMSTGFKRRVTNQLKKVYDGADGAGSKATEEEQDILGYDVLGVTLPPYNMDYLVKLYEISSPHYAAVNAKVANIVGLGYNFVETDKTTRAFERIDDDDKSAKAQQKIAQLKTDLQDELESFNNEDSLTETFVKIWRDYEVTGNGYMEIGRKKDGSIGYIGHIPAQTMRVRRQRDGYVQLANAKMEFFANFGAGAPDEDGNVPSITNPIGSDTHPNEVIHIKRYSPTSSYYGIPDIVAAKQALAGNEFASRFNLEYFENKAIPRHLIVLKGARLGGSDERALLEFFETSLKGQNHRTLYVPLPGDTDSQKVDLKIEPIEAGIQDSSFGNFHKSNTEDILMVHRTPSTKVNINSDINLAVAQIADKTFKEEVCAPEQRMFESKFNKVIKEMTDALKFALNEMTLTDADTQSQIDDRDIKNGSLLPNEARKAKGKPAIEGGDIPVDLNAKSNTLQSENLTTRQRDQARTDNATDSKGQARNPKGSGRTPGTS